MCKESGGAASSWIAVRRSPTIVQRGHRCDQFYAPLVLAEWLLTSGSSSEWDRPGKSDEHDELAEDTAHTTFCRGEHATTQNGICPLDGGNGRGVDAGFVAAAPLSGPTPGNNAPSLAVGEPYDGSESTFSLCSRACHVT